MDEEDKKFITSLPTCYAYFVAFDSRDVSKEIAILQCIMNVAKNEFIGNNSFWVYMMEQAI